MMRSKLAFYDRAHEQILQAMRAVQPLGIGDAMIALQEADDEVLKYRDQYLQELTEEIERR